MLIASVWIKIWEIVLIVGFGSFAILVLTIIPLGARDVFRLFRALDSKSAQPEEMQDSDHT